MENQNFFHDSTKNKVAAFSPFTSFQDGWLFKDGRKSWMRLMLKSLCDGVKLTCVMISE